MNKMKKKREELALTSFTFDTCLKEIATRRKSPNHHQNKGKAKQRRRRRKLRAAQMSPNFSSLNTLFFLICPPHFLFNSPHVPP